MGGKTEGEEEKEGRMDCGWAGYAWERRQVCHI
jgi:hypothetical protein